MSHTMVWPAITLGLVGVLSCMSPHVIGLVMLVLKLLTTHITLVRCLPCMSPGMSVQVHNILAIQITLTNGFSPS